MMELRHLDAMISNRHPQLKTDDKTPVNIAKAERWQSKTALLVALGMTSTAALPILIAPPTMAGQAPIVGQLLSQSSQVTVAAGTTIPVRYDSAERIIITPKETVPVTLIVAKNIRSASGKILIPVGSQVKGQLKPAQGGSQFVAQELIFRKSGQRLPINAVSETITTTQTIAEKTHPNILEDAAIGAAAGALLGVYLAAFAQDKSWLVLELVLESQHWREVGNKRNLL